MKISTQKVKDILIINIEEKDANLSNSEQFKELIFTEIDQGNHRLIISFEEVEYVDSSFLGALVAILKKLIGSGGRLALIGLNEDIKHLFDLTRLDKVFTVETNLDTAITHFS